MARRRGWLDRISPRMLGDRLALVISMYYDLMERAGSLDPLVRRYLPIAIATCLELFYRQMGQRRFNPRTSMHTPINVSITLADMDEFRRVLNLFGQADLFWHNRRVQGVDDIKAVQAELGMTSVFKGDPELLDATHRMYSVRNDNTHGMGDRRYDVHQFLWALRRHIEKGLEQMPPLFAVFLLIGARRAAMRGDKEAADALYRRTIKEADASGADPSTCQVIAGKAAEWSGDRGEAINRYKRAIVADSGNAGAHAAMGCILAQSGRGADALAEYDRAVEIEPKYANAHMGRGHVLVRLGRPDEALESYKRAAEADPLDAEAHIAAGAVYESQGRLSEALESYKRAAEADPLDAEAHIAAGAVYESQGRLSEALESYKRAAEADPLDAEAHIAAGRLHMLQGRQAEALESYKRAAEADPSSAKVHIAAGAVHESQGRLSEALESYKRAAESDPSSAGAYTVAGALDKGQDDTAGFRPGRNDAADPAGAKESAGRTRGRLLKKRGWLRDADDVTRHIKHSGSRQSDDRR